MTSKPPLGKTPPPIRGYMTRRKAIELLSPFLIPHADKVDLDLQDAVRFAIKDMQMVENAHHVTSDGRD